MSISISIPRGRKVVPFWGLYIESYKVTPKKELLWGLWVSISTSISIPISIYVYIYIYIYIYIYTLNPKPHILNPVPTKESSDFLPQCDGLWLDVRLDVCGIDGQSARALDLRLSLGI